MDQNRWKHEDCQVSLFATVSRHHVSSFYVMLCQGNFITHHLDHIRFVKVILVIVRGHNMTVRNFYTCCSDLAKCHDQRHVRSHHCYYSVGCNGICWAVDKKDTVWRRLGAKVCMQIRKKPPSPQLSKSMCALGKNVYDFVRITKDKGFFFSFLSSRIFIKIYLSFLTMNMNSF